jgi:hypothetical protein
MTEEQTDRAQTALALQRDIQDRRAELVADIDRLRGAVRERISIRYILQTHPRLTQALTIGLGVSGVLALGLIWRATKAARQNGSA